MPAVHTDAIFVEIFTVAFRAYLLAGMVGHTKYTPQKTKSRHEKTDLSNQQQERVSESTQTEENVLALCSAQWRKRRIT